MSGKMEIVDDDDDSISVTSTVWSEQRSEYEVETIMTELSFPDGVKYLVKWAGYPLERCTWEPGNSFADPQTLRDWRAKKKAISRGEQLEFDLEAWENRVEALEDARDERTRKRRAKRIRLGLPVSLTDDEAQQEGEISNPTNNTDDATFAKQEEEEQCPPPSGPWLDMANLEAASDAQLPGNRSRIRSKSETHQQNTSRGDVDASSHDQALQHDGQNGTFGQPVLAQAASSRPGRFAPFTLSSHGVTAKRPEPLLLPRGPARNPRSLGASLRARKQKLKARELSGASPPKLFKNLSTRWKYQKATRFEPAPDINQLDVRRPSEWATNPNAPSSSHPARSLSNQRRHSDDLFVEQDSLTVTAPGLHSLPNPIESQSPQRPRPSRTVSLGVAPVSSHSLPAHADSRRPPPPRRLSYSQVPPESNLPAQPVQDRSWDINAMGIAPPREPRTHRGLVQNFPSRAWEVGTVRRFNPGEVLVSVYYGPDKTEIGPTRICGVTPTTRAMLIGLKKERKDDIEVWFQHICTSEQYEFLCRGTRNIKYCNGWIEGFADTAPRVSRMAKSLRDGDLVGIFYLDNGRLPNVFLAYATGSVNFDFLNQDAIIKPGASLRIAVRSALTPIQTLPSFISTGLSAEQQASALASPEQETAPAAILGPSPLPSMPSTSGGFKQAGKPLNSEEPTPAPTQQDSTTDDVIMTDGAHDEGTQAAISQEKIDLDLFFKEQYGITFRKLATVNGPKSDKVAQVFYLWFPDDVEAEYQVFKEFLKKYKVVTYSNRLPEDWERFARTVTHGVVVFHGDFVDFQDLPYFLDVMRKDVNFWSVSLSTPLKYVDRPMNLQRIFPHGGVILLTEDFMTYEQDATLIILAWFHDMIRKKFPGSWKIMFRPDIQNWLLKKHDESEKSENKMQARWIVMYCLIQKLLPVCHHYHDPEVPNHLDGGYEDDGVHNPVISFKNIPNYGCRSEAEHPAIPKGLKQEQRDTDHLVEFFGGWSLINCHRYRRFVVATYHSEARWKAWNHLELRCRARDVLKNLNIDHKAYWAKVTAPVKQTSGQVSKEQPLTAYTPRTPAASSSKGGQSSSKPQPPPPTFPQAPSTFNYPQPYV